MKKQQAPKRKAITLPLIALAAAVVLFASIPISVIVAIAIRATQSRPALLAR